MDEVPELASRLGVDARGRLVEQQELRLVQDAGGKRKALLPAAGKLRGKLVATAGEPPALHDATHYRACVGHLEDACHEIEILEHRQVVVEAELLRHVADLAADQRRLPDDVEPETGAVSTVGDEEPAQYANGGGLAAAIGAEKAADFTLGDLQAQPIDYLQGTEALSQVMDIDDIVGHRGSPRFVLGDRRRRERSHRHRLAGIDACCALARWARLHHLDEL